MWQFCFRTDDPEINASIEYEHVRQSAADPAAKCSRSAALLALVLDGIRYRRLLREREALRVYSVQQSAAREQEKEQG